MSERSEAPARRWRLPAIGLLGRRRSSTPPDEPLVAMRRLVVDLMAGRETSTQRAVATELAAQYRTLGAADRLAALRQLATDFGTDRVAVDAAIEAVRTAPDDAERAEAEAQLRAALTPQYLQLAPLITALPRGVKLLVDLREDLLTLVGADAAMAALDADLRAHLRTLFDVGLLELSRITWDSPAALLEKLIRYEAVNEIQSWDDLRRRLDKDRRFYAFFHPAMPGEPLVFVEVALTQGMATELPALLDVERDNVPADEADTAIFYAITNPHQGLAGVQLGNELIKRVVDEVRRDHPHVMTFATLSPVPGFRRWYDAVQRAAIGDGDGASAGAGGPRASEPSADREQLLRGCVRYLLEAKRGRRALDPVANFHLSNGASLASVNWQGDPSPAGIERSYGITVNYLYDPSRIAANARAYLEDGTIAVADPVVALRDRLTG